jgi:DNA repair protein RadC
MGRDFLDAGNFSPKERAILTRAARILEAKVRAADSVALNSPALVREWLALQFSGLEREVFGVIYLDAQHRLIGFEALFTGTLTQTSVYPREVVKSALARNAAAVMFVHNHPSGCAEPSQADQVLTETLKRALAMVDTKVLDHFIVGGSVVLAFSERGLI